MARATTRTKLPLDRWGELMGLSPLHFNQVFISPLPLCGQPTLQYAWQSADRVGREDVARAIAQAEADIESYLSFRLIPSWEVDEWRPTIHPHRPELFNTYANDFRGRGQVAFASWKHFVSGGIRAKQVIQAAAGVTYSDPDGDGYKETATITVAVTFPSPCDLAMYYPGQSGADEWEIRPIKASITAGVATITARREQLLKPELMSLVLGSANDPTVRGADGAVDGNFLTTVDVYRRYNDPQQQATLLWEPTGCAGCGGSGCETCSYQVQTACLLTRGNPAHGIVAYHPGKWDQPTLDFVAEALAVAREPDVVRLWYYAGLRDKALSCPNLEMSHEWAYAVAVYAASLLERPVCGCNNVSEFISSWQQDATENPDATVGRDILDCPFGSKKGAVYAWRKVRQAAIARETVNA